MSTIFRLSFLSFCFLLPASDALAEDAEQKSIKIGHIADLSGIGAFFSSQSHRGCKLAAEATTSQFGVKTEVVVEDIAGKFPAAVNAAVKLLTSDRVDAVICDLTGPCQAVADMVEKAGKPLIYHSPATSISAKHSQSYRNFLDYTAACGAMAEYWKAKGEENIGSLNANAEFGERCLQGVQKVLPQHFSQLYNPGDDPRSAILSFSQKKISKIIFTGYDSDFITWLKLSHSQNISLTTGVVQLLYTEAFWNQIGDVPVGGITAGFAEIPKDFIEKMEKKFGSGKDANYQAAALGYNAVTALAEAFAACPTKDLPCLKGKLEAERREGLLGFRGWKRGVSEYPLVLKRVAGRDIVAIESAAEEKKER